MATVASVSGNTITMSDGTKLQIGAPGSLAAASGPGPKGMQGGTTGAPIGLGYSGEAGTANDPTGSVGASLGGVMTGPTPAGTGMASDIPAGQTLHPDGTITKDAPAATPMAPVAPVAPVVTPPVVPKAPVPPPVDYNAEYNRELATARAGLDNQFRSSLAAINAAGTASQGQVSQMPGQINTIYNGAAAMGAPGAKGTLAADKAAGVTGKGYAAPANSAGTVALANNKATELASVPALHAAVAEDVSNRTATLADANQTAQNALNMHAMDIAAAQANGAQAHAWSVADAKTAYDNSKTLYDLGKGNASAQLAAAPSKLVPGLTNQQVTDITNSPHYLNAVADISSHVIVADNGKSAPVTPKFIIDTMGVANSSSTPADHQALQVLEATYPNFFASAK